SSGSTAKRKKLACPLLHTDAAAAGLHRRARFAPWKISFSGAWLTTTPAVGVCRTPVSRLFGSGVGHSADSVLIAAGGRDTSEADSELSRVTALKVAATQPRRRGLSGLASQSSSPHARQNMYTPRVRTR